MKKVEPQKMRDQLSLSPWPLLLGVRDAQMLMVETLPSFKHLYDGHRSCPARAHVGDAMAQLITYITHLEATVQLVTQRTDGEHGWCTFNELIPPATANQAETN